MNKIVSAFTAFLFLSILGMVSCQKAIVDNLDNVVVNKQHLVSLQVNEEAINIISESPLFKSAKSLTRTDESKKVYAINIYCKDGITTKNYSKYAYGLFDDPSQIKLLLTEGKIYKFECLVVEDNEDKIYSSNGEYLMPFKHGALADDADCFPTKLENKFVLSSTENLPFIIYGRTNISKDDVAEAPRMIKQYGVLENYSAEANSTIIPHTIGTNFNNPRPKDRIITATNNEIKAKNQFVFAISTAEAERESPIRIITGPITTGGNNLSSIFFPFHFIKAAITKYTKETPIIPNSVPGIPHCLDADIIGAINANEEPKKIGTLPFVTK